MARLFHPFRLTQFLKLQIRNHNTILTENVTELNEKTLTGRLLVYLNNNNVSTPKLNQVNNNLNRTDIEQLKTSIKYLNISQNISDLNTLQSLDIECSKRVSKMNTNDIFELLYVYMSKVPHRITWYKFYDRSMKELSYRLNYLNKNDIIQYIFYIGLKKKFTRSHDVVRQCLNNLYKSDLNALTAEDLCVICNSTFKTTTRINSELFWSTIITYLYNNLHLFKDPAFFVTFLKSIRQNRYQDEDLLSTITCTIFFNKTIEVYSFTALCHILAVYSDYLFYDENILKAFTEKCIYTLKNLVLEQPRLKDIKRFLWCISNLNYKGLEKDDIKNVIIPNVLSRIKAGDVEENFSSIIEITLYLWMLNYRAYELVPYFMNKSIIDSINELNTPIKQRLNLLISCMFFEEKQLLNNIHPKPNEYDMSTQLKKRTLLQKVITNLNGISKKHELNRFEMSCQVPGIHIIGVTGYKKNLYKTVYIEVLDEYTTLKNTENLPTGPMQLKLRLLDQLEEAVILVDSDEVGAMNDTEIQQVLLEEIEFVC